MEEEVAKEGKDAEEIVQPEGGIVEQMCVLWPLIQLRVYSRLAGPCSKDCPSAVERVVLWGSRV